MLREFQEEIARLKAELAARQAGKAMPSAASPEVRALEACTVGTSCAVAECRCGFGWPPKLGWHCQVTGCVILHGYR